MKQPGVRFPPAILDRIQEEVRQANAAAGWEKFTTSDVVRDLVQEALDARRRARVAANPDLVAGAKAELARRQVDAQEPPRSPRRSGRAAGGDDGDV